LIRAEVLKATARFEDPEVAFRVLDRSGIMFDEENNVIGVAEAVEALAKQHPWMLRRSNASQTSTAAPASKTAASTRDDEARRKDYFGMQQSEFWQGGGAKKILESD
jgi:hypothetical protein